LYRERSKMFAYSQFLVFQMIPSNPNSSESLEKDVLIIPFLEESDSK
jgi:hypothetical protein